MLSPWGHIQNSRHYNIKGLSFVTPRERSRWRVLHVDAFVERHKGAVVVTLLSLVLFCVRIPNFVSLLFRS